MGLVALLCRNVAEVQMRARHDAERTALGRHILQVGEAVTGRGRGVGVRLEVCARRVVGPHIGVAKRIAVPLCYSIKLVGRPAGEPSYLKTVELYKGAHDPLGKVEHVGIEQVWFEQVGERWMGHQVGDRRARSVGVFGKASCKLTVYRCAYLFQERARHVVAEESESVALVLCEMLF